MSFVLDAMRELRAFGFDTDDPDIRDRCYRVGAERYERHVAKMQTTPQFDGRWPTIDGRSVNPRAHDPIVYYARLADLVKIGTTIQVGQRLGSIFATSIMSIEFGSYELERQRHQQFEHLRRRGEWFELTDELGTHIVERRAQFELEQGVTVETWLAKRLPQPKRRKSSVKTLGPSPDGHAATA